jgi:hypothetical protein
MTKKSKLDIYDTLLETAQRLRVLVPPRKLSPKGWREVLDVLDAAEEANK